MSYNSKYFDRKPGSLENAVLEALGGQINEASMDVNLDDDKRLIQNIEKMKVKVKILSRATSGRGRIDVRLTGSKNDINKVVDRNQTSMRTDNDFAFNESTEVVEAKMDKVNPTAAKKKFDDRKDKDIDNDGDVDSSDKYLHKRRKAIGKAMSKEEKDDFRTHMMYDPKTGKEVTAKTPEDHEKYSKMGYTHDKPKMEGLEDSPNPANSQHLCAKNVVHEEWGEGQCVPTMHADPDADGNVAWYDVMFEHGIEKGVLINELKVTHAESHHHGKKKKVSEEVELDESLLPLFFALWGVGAMVVLPGVIIYDVVNRSNRRGDYLDAKVGKIVGNMVSKFKKDKNYKPTSAEVDASKKLEKEVKSKEPSIFKKAMSILKSIKSKKEEVELGEGKMKELAGKIATVYKKMKSDSTMKPFADKFRADVKKSLDIRKSLEKVLPDYVAGGDITKLMSEASELGTPERTKHTLDVTPGQSMEDWNKAVGVMQEKNDTMRQALAKMWGVEESNNKNPFGEAADFKPHKMYDPKTGEAHDAKTMDDHLRMKKMGYTHTEPKKEQKTMTGQPATKVTVDPDMKEKKNIA